MAESSESEHGYYERCADSTCNNKSKSLEEGKITKKQAEATSKRSDTTTENTDSHFSISLSHFVVPLVVGWMHVVCREMHDIIDWEADQNNERNRLCGSKLQISHVHEGHNSDNNDRYAPYRYNALNDVSGGVKKNEEGEENWNDNSL